MVAMAQTLGSDVPFVMLTASEVFSLEVSDSERHKGRNDADVVRYQRRNPLLRLSGGRLE